MTALLELPVPREEVARLAENAMKRAGASEEVAELLVDAALFAEDRGMRGVGVAHLLDYLHAIDDGRLDAAAIPTVDRLAPAILSCNAHGGPFHTGFGAAIDDLVAAARSEGVAMFLQSGAFAGGQLGWFTERLSTHGLVALGAINSNALLATAPGTGRVLGTNPMSYSFPRPAGEVMTVDQSSSAAAYVNVREAAAHGRPIPEDGRSTPPANRRPTPKLRWMGPCSRSAATRVPTSHGWSSCLRVCRAGTGRSTPRPSTQARRIPGSGCSYWRST